ncbi:hypothetical protein Q1695_005565 [Nippostrongylus brasiliensis]|nr:hypothetical protein Q1695_005565 [Nippostrongylus brasiliensis]
MGRHKRIPTKNRKKLKSVDPFNKKAPALKAAAISKINWEPKDDEQPIPRALKELEKSKAEGVVDKQVMKKRRQHKNKVLAEADKIGIKKGRFESVEHFVRRVERMTYAAIKDHDTLVKQGLVGRDEKDLEADFKLLEEKEKRAKEQKKNEIQNKIKAAREKREREAKIKEERLLEKEERKRKRKLQDEDDAESDKNDEKEHDEMNADGMTSSKSGDPEVKRKKKKFGGSDKIREKKKLAADIARKEAVLNQREVIAFGERYDAPPVFKGVMKKEMNPLMAKAGGKNLLLHSLLRQNTGEKTTYLDEDKRQKPGELERQRVIEAYREMKKNKRNRDV